MPRETGTDLYVLGIESSCDETAAAVVKNGRQILSNVIASQADLHRSYGGVVPELASRVHLETIIPVIDSALREAGLQLAEIDLIAATNGPGLVGALLVGLTAAKGLALAAQKPLVGVQHLAGHIAANYLSDPELEPPFLCLVVSGAHSHIVQVNAYTDFKVLARTRDDAAGEAFDKVARSIGLGYPGGPLLDKAAREGNPEAVDLPRTTMAGSFDFSFSGVKTAALNQLNRLQQQASQQGGSWQDQVSLADFAASFQRAVVDVLVDHTFAALAATGQKRLVIAGGVAANSCLRQQMADRSAKEGVRLSFPPLILCTDNAAMIAAAGYYAHKAGRTDDLSLNAVPYLELGGD